MGTRADFYVGRTEDAEWLGSIAWDGYPDGIEAKIREAVDEAEYRRQVGAFIGSREDGTKPEQGWPWPWDDSGTTDYAYAFDGGSVYGSCFGRPWFEAAGKEPDEPEGTRPTFPDMSERKVTTLGPRSGVIVIPEVGL